MEKILGALKKETEIELSVTGRVSGKIIPRPVWFVLSKGDKSILLIPVQGRKTQWYLNVKKNPNVTVNVGDQSFKGSIAELGSGRLKEVLAAFTVKYGKEDIDSYYPKKEVALEIPLPSSVP
jgi:hypothetical protein